MGKEKSVNIGRPQSAESLGFHVEVGCQVLLRNYL